MPTPAHPRRKRRRLIGVVVLLAAGLTAVVGGCSADRLVLGSNHSVIDSSGLQRRIVRVDNEDVECWTARSPGAQARQPVAFVIFLTGKADRADRWTRMVAESWRDKPVEVWGMNYPGAGGSTGPPRLARVTPSVLAVYDAMRIEAGKRPIIVQGASFGAAIALDLARRRPVTGLLVWNPPPLRQLLLGYYGWWNLWLLAGPVSSQLPPDIDAIDNAAHVHVPAAFVKCTGDYIVPPRYQQLVYDAYVGPKHLIINQGAGHGSPLTAEASKQLDIERNWIWNGSFPKNTP